MCNQKVKPSLERISAEFWLRDGMIPIDTKDIITAYVQIPPNQTENNESKENDDVTQTINFKALSDKGSTISVVGPTKASELEQIGYKREKEEAFEVSTIGDKHVDLNGEYFYLHIQRPNSKYICSNSSIYW